MLNFPYHKNKTFKSKSETTIKQTPVSKCTFASQDSKWGFDVSLGMDMFIIVCCFIAQFRKPCWTITSNPQYEYPSPFLNCQALVFLYLICIIQICSLRLFELRLMFEQTFATKPKTKIRIINSVSKISKARFHFLFEPLQVHIAVVVAIAVTNYVIIVINCIGQCHHSDILGRCVGRRHDRDELHSGMCTAVYSTL